MSNVFQSDGQQRPAIRFSSGLNTILGDESGTNSIGKSTFLMIIDFVFGGSDYLKKSTDVQKQLGVHTIHFTYCFKAHHYHFSRSTGDPTHVNICDVDYNILETIHLDQFKDFLYEQYDLSLPNISFRAIISRFFRVYGRDNLDEKKPLHTMPSEATAEAIKNLLKLFDNYSPIKELETLATESKKKKSAFKNAQKYAFIPQIKKKEYEQNQKQIVALQSELEQLIQTNHIQLLGLDAQQAERLSKLKGNLSLAKRERTKLYTQLNTLVSHSGNTLAHLEHNYNELARFFPDTNIKHLQELETFHRSLNTILASEIAIEKTRLTGLIELSTAKIHSIEEQIEELGVTPDISKTALDKYASTENTIQTLQRQNEAYEQTKALQATTQELNQALISLLSELTTEVQDNINVEMDRINDFIYKGKKHAPLLTIYPPNSYIFSTPNDGGTGTNYKGLIVFDLAMLHLTPLPALTHDSVLLKQIGDAPLESILELYSKSEKQIFIALDKESSYSARSQAILTQAVVLRLSENGNELFGRSWNQKQ